jgi:hypothetical protein
LRWRMEHGRIAVWRSAAPLNPELFYVDVNSEGIRWGFEWEYGGMGDWRVVVPLWALLAPSLGAAKWTWLPRRRGAAGVCARCGYDVSTLPAGSVCPECGRGAR